MRNKLMVFVPLALLSLASCGDEEKDDKDNLYANIVPNGQDEEQPGNNGEQNGNDGEQNGNNGEDLPPVPEATADPIVGTWQMRLGNKETGEAGTNYTFYYTFSQDGYGTLKDLNTGETEEFSYAKTKDSLLIVTRDKIWRYGYSIRNNEMFTKLCIVKTSGYKYTRCENKNADPLLINTWYGVHDKLSWSLTLNADGTGHMKDLVVDNDLTWTLDGDRITLAFDYGKKETLTWKIESGYYDTHVGINGGAGFDYSDNILTLEEKQFLMTSNTWKRIE